MSLSVVHERKRICMKIFNQIADVSLNRGGRPDLSDMSGVEPMHQARQAPKTCAGAAMPESPFGATEFADWMDLQVVAESAGAKASRRLQGVFKTHGDMKPIEDESCLLEDLPLQLP